MYSYGHRRQPSLKHFLEWRSEEAQKRPCGEIPEYQTVVLRESPPRIEVVNPEGGSVTHVTVDSANRPGTLVEVVQHFTELALEIRSARISSDGGWFVDSFEICEADGGQVTNPRKLESIRRMLDVYNVEDEGVANDADETDDVARTETTVFELAGEDKPGLLSETTRLLTANGCNVRSAAVWTYNKRAAFVLSVTEKGRPVRDNIKLQRLRQILFNLVDTLDDGIINIKTVRGEIHHDRRLHQLMLAEEQKGWDRSRGLSTLPALPADDEQTLGLDEPLLSFSSSLGSSAHIAQAASLADSASSIYSDHVDAAADAHLHRSHKHSRPVVRITTDARRGYWLVAITCKDRNKLLFDTVCTLADMHYDVFHATIDSQDGVAMQEYWVKACNGSTVWEETKAQKLVAMMEAAIQRRFPTGVKLHVHSSDRFGCLAELTQTLHDSRLSITRAKVRTYAVNKCCGHTFYVVGPDGSPPDTQHLEGVCSQVGGRLVDTIEEGRPQSPPLPHRFSFSLLRQWHKGWDGVAASPTGSSAASL